MLGRELLLDTGLADATKWTVSGGCSVSANAGHFAGAGTIRQTITVTQGYQYQVIFRIKNYQSGSGWISLGTTNGTTRSADGLYTQTITCGSTSTYTFQVAGNGTFDVDDVSVKPIIKGIHPHLHLIRNHV